MGGYHGLVYDPKCSHGVSRYTRCATCDEEREAMALAHRKSVNDPAQSLRDAEDRARPWFKRCGLCRWGRRGPDLVQVEQHDPECPYVHAYETAKVKYILFLVERMSPGTLVRCTPDPNRR